MNTAITSLLPVNSNIHDTPFEELVNNTIGYFLELVEGEVLQMKNGCFIDTAEGRYLDYWGKDLGIKRLNGESDEDYRVRLMIGPLEQFSVNTVYELYNLQLLTYHPDYTDLMLLSDNHFLDSTFFVDCPDNVWEELNKKFIAHVLERLP